MTLARAASLTSGPISRLVEAVADAQRPGPLGEQVDEAVVDRIDHEEALGRGADLAGEMEGGGDAPAAATSSGACAVMIIGSLPPASMTQGFIRSAQATATALPAATEPVKATAWVRSEAISACAVAAPPGRQETRPVAASERNTFM